MSEDGGHCRNHGALNCCLVREKTGGPEGDQKGCVRCHYERTAVTDIGGVLNWTLQTALTDIDEILNCTLRTALTDIGEMLNWTLRTADRYR